MITPAPRTAGTSRSTFPARSSSSFPGADHLAYSGDVGALLDEIEDFLTGRRRGSRIAYSRRLSSRTLSIRRRGWPLCTTPTGAPTSTLTTRVLRASIARFEGRVVNTTGDGFVAAFEVPTQALRCARAMVATGFGLRVGVHTGECERRNDDLAGLAVHVRRTSQRSQNRARSSSRGTVRDLVSGSGLQVRRPRSPRTQGHPGIMATLRARTKNAGVSVEARFVLGAFRLTCVTEHRRVGLHRAWCR